MPGWAAESARGGSQSRQVLATGGNPAVVRAADSMLRRADRAQAGNRRLHDQADYRGFGESGPFEGSLSAVALA